MPRPDPTYGHCECCGVLAPLAPSLWDRAPLCAECRRTEWDDGAVLTVRAQDAADLLLAGLLT